MLKYIIKLMVFATLGSIYAAPEKGEIRGRVIDFTTNEPVPGATVFVVEKSLGTQTSATGEFKIENVPPGRYTIKATMIGYTPEVKTDVVVHTVHPIVVEFALQQTAIELQSITVTDDYFQKSPNTVNSITSFNYEEIRRAPGGFEDVVRALSILPGIAQAEPGRNDLVVRGGAPSENLYLIDGIVVPNINHFGSQGATGGPLSYVDLNYVDDVSFSTGGFPANYGDKISSVLKIKLAEGRNDRFGGKLTISATQFGVNVDGPLNDHTNILFSARRSYLDFIFKAAGFGFVPEYYDALTKATMKLNNGTLSFLFISAFDNVRYFNNTSDQRYDNSRTLGNDQVQYVTALSYKHLINNGFYNITLSRNFTDFDISQKDTLQNPIFLNKSLEKENTLNGDVVYKPSKNSEINFGLSVKYNQFSTDIKLPVFKTSFGDTLNITQLTMRNNYSKAGMYLQYTNRLNEWLSLNAGLRLDYFSGITSPYNLSPKFSLSFYPDLLSSINITSGIYYQSPSYIWLAGDAKNKDLNSIKAVHLILGYERRITEDMQFRVEGFSKFYSDYPASILRPYLILSNTGAGFGGSEDNFSSFALEPLTSKGKGIVKGVEIQIQKKSSKVPYYGISSLTYSKAEFKALDGVKRPGSFDQNWIFNFSAGYIFNNEWEASMKFRYATGRPFTPFNSAGTQSIQLINSQRLKATHSLDIRVDRRWNFRNWALIIYTDIQNIYNRKNISSIRWDYKNGKIEESSGLGILPSIGISAEF